jgi:hypothetical protein
MCAMKTNDRGMNSMNDKCFVDTGILVYEHDRSLTRPGPNPTAVPTAVTNTPESVLQALDIELRYKISFWDALILQAAEFSGASILYSEDLATGQRYRTLRVINP